MYAGGYVIPPMIIFDRKRLKPEFTVGEIPGMQFQDGFTRSYLRTGSASNFYSILGLERIPDYPVNYLLH